MSRNVTVHVRVRFDCTQEQIDNGDYYFNSLMDGADVVGQEVLEFNEDTGMGKVKLLISMDDNDDGIEVSDVINDMDYAAHTEILDHEIMK